MYAPARLPDGVDSLDRSDARPARRLSGVRAPRRGAATARRTALACAGPRGDS